MSLTAAKKSLALNKLVFKLFNGMIPVKGNLSFKDVNEFAVKHGYLVHPDLCNQDVIDLIELNEINYNATFYKHWSTIINKDRFELYIDQLMHYASTYGTNHTGEPYIAEIDVNVPPLTSLKVITSLTKKEVVSRCKNMLYSGIALSTDTINDILNILDELKGSLEIDLVKNKEAKMYLYKKTNTTPSDAVEMVRYLVYLFTEQTLLIKDKKTIDLIKANNRKVNLSALDLDSVVLSSVFFRFKPLFLAMRGSASNSTYVNRLRKLANKYHEPIEVGFFESILSKKKDLKEVIKRLNSVTNFKKILLLQTIGIKLKNLNTKVYLVRNQKVFIKEEENKKVDAKYLTELYHIIYTSLVVSLNSKACAVKLPKGINLTLPTSEKSFIGNYPLGSSFDLSDGDGIVGIYWRGEDGANDIDLSLMSIDGRKYGWNAEYKNQNNSVLYSGDMTSAYPEATELFYASRDFNPSLVKVNLFGGAIGSKFKFFIAKEKIENLNRNYMVDPNNILGQFESTMDSREKSLGVLTEDKFILAQFRTGNKIVSRHSITELYTNYSLSTLDTYLSLEKVLRDSGFTITDENPDLDLSNVSKDSLIDLFSK